MKQYSVADPGTSGGGAIRGPSASEASDGKENSGGLFPEIFES